jgi:uncharacterized SAM-binding protein YcdF (DUF218 family)
VALVAVLACVPFLGSMLVVDDPIERADAIFVLAGERVSRWLEARDLFNEGYAPVVALSAGQWGHAEKLASQQGVRIENEGERARKALVALGVPAGQIVVVPGHPDNTADEASQLRDLSHARGWRTVIVVSSKLHTRRAAFAIRRALEGTSVRIVMRSSRYDEDDPARWWRRRSSIRNVMHELPALVAYLLGLGS